MVVQFLIFGSNEQAIALFEVWLTYNVKTLFYLIGFFGCFLMSDIAENKTT